MKKIFTFFIFILIIYLILLNSYEIMESIRFSFSLCINNLFPSLIPFMLLSNILINYNFINDLSNIFLKLMKLFKINKNCSFAFIMSILSGSPSNAKYLNDLYNNKLINESDIQNSLNFIHFVNPIFILGTIGYTFLNDKKLGLIILISHYLSALLLGLFNKKNSLNIDTNIKIKNNNNFIKILKDSINSTISTLLLILGIITTCIIITTILNNLIDIKCKYIYGVLEITQGLKYLSISNLDLKLKTIISSFLISFGGFCIHAQVFSIIENKKIRYLPYLKSRIIHGLFSSLLTYILI